MNIRQQDRFSSAGEREALERLSVFLPASVVRALKEQVPAGRRSHFIAAALKAALDRGQAAKAQPAEKHEA